MWSFWLVGLVRFSAFFLFEHACVFVVVVVFVCLFFFLLDLCALAVMPG